MDIRRFIALIAVVIAAGATIGITPRASAAERGSAPVAPTERLLVRLALPDYQHDALLAPPAQAAQQAAIDRVQDDFARRLKATGARVHRRLTYTPVVAVRGPAGTADAVRRLPGVDKVTDDLRGQLDLAESVDIVQADEIQEAGHGGSGRAVAIIDNGFDTSHPMLSGRVVREACFSVRCDNGETTHYGTGTARHCTASGLKCEHGTHVAGIAAGRLANFTTRNGVAPKADIIAIRISSVVDDADTCWPNEPPCAPIDISDVLAALEHVYSMRDAHSIAAASMSLGFCCFVDSCTSPDFYDPVLENLHAANIAVIAASGNDGFRDTQNAPACLNHVISVASVDKAGVLAPSSNVGPSTDLAAVGVGVRSAIPAGGMAARSGTSMAAPHVAGAFALLRELRPSATVDQLLADLKTYGVPTDDNRPYGERDNLPALRLLAPSKLSTLGFAPAAVSVGENAASVDVNIQRYITGPSSSVSVRTVTGSARSTDFTAVDTRLHFASGEQTKTVTIPITADTLAERDEAFTVELYDPSGTSFVDGAGRAKVTIVEDDIVVNLAATAHRAVKENSEFAVELRRSGQMKPAVTVNYALESLSATAYEDFPGGAGTATFAAGSASTIVRIPIPDDDIAERPEQFRLRLMPTTGVIIGSPKYADLTIHEDEPGLVIDSYGYETAEGQPSLKVAFRRVGSTTGTLQGRVATRDGTAGEDDGDYTGFDEVISFPEGTNVLTRLIPIGDDAAVEGGEEFTIHLEAIDAQSPPAPSVVHIADNDSGFRFAASSYQVSETATYRTVTVARDGATTATQSVDFATEDISATAGVDYAAKSGTLTFAPGEATKTFAVSLRPDTLPEGDESFTVKLSNPTAGAVLLPATVTTVTVIDDDRGINFGAAAVPATEGGASRTLDLVRSGPADVVISVDVSVSGGTATNPSDYSFSPARYTLGIGEFSKTITVPIGNDTVAEDDETAVFALGNASGAPIGTRPTSTLTITDDEPGWTFASARTYQKEDVSFGSVTIRRTGPVTGSFTFELAGQDGTATAGSDYVIPEGRFTFSDGQRSMNAGAFGLLNDTALEGNETFTIAVRPGEGAPPFVGVNAHTVNLYDDEVGFRFSTGRSAAPEAGGGHVVTVERVGDASKHITVQYRTANGSAVAGSDYTSTSGTLTLAPRVSSASFTVPILDDRVIEGNQTFSVILENPTGGASLGSPSTATVVIVDDEGRGQLGGSSGLERRR